MAKISGTMMHLLFLCCPVIATLVSPGSCYALRHGLGNITNELEELMGLAGGDYDNLLQYLNDIDRQLPPNQRHIHLHAKFYKTKIPALGDNYFFYVQEHENGDPTQVYSQSVNSFFINITTWEIRMRIYKFVSPDIAKKYINAFDNPAIFKDLKISDLTYNDECGVTWSKTGPEMFVGKMTMGACVLPYKGIDIIIYDENILSTTYLTVHEQWFVKSNGTRILGKLSPFNETRQPVEADRRNPMLPFRFNNRL